MVTIWEEKVFVGTIFELFTDNTTKYTTHIQHKRAYELQRAQECLGNEYSELCGIGIGRMKGRDYSGGESRL